MTKLGSNQCLGWHQGVISPKGRGSHSNKKMRKFPAGQRLSSSWWVNFGRNVIRTLAKHKCKLSWVTDQNKKNPEFIRKWAYPRHLNTILDDQKRIPSGIIVWSVKKMKRHHREGDILGTCLYMDLLLTQSTSTRTLYRTSIGWIQVTYNPKFIWYLFEMTDHLLMTGECLCSLSFLNTARLHVMMRLFGIGSDPV